MALWRLLVDGRPRLAPPIRRGGAAPHRAGWAVPRPLPGSCIIVAASLVEEESDRLDGRESPT